MTDLSSTPEVYTPTGTPNAAWAPTVTNVANCVTPNGAYVLSGTQLNGLSEGAAYGDDVAAATNYPLVRIVNNGTGHVFYARTFNHSTMSTAPGTAGTTNFTVAANTEAGASVLFVVTNGIPSAGTAVTVSTTCNGGGARTATHDFNGDGKSDIAWRQTGGSTAIWLMNGLQVSQSGSLGTVPAIWSLVGQRDFNGHGKADLLWRDTGGNLAMWFLNGIQTIGSASIGNVPTTWTVVGTGDFTGDGFGDILWRDNAGNLAVWLMNGTTVLQSGVVGNVPTNWIVAGTGDFNGDGKADIVWRDTAPARWQSGS